MAVVYSEQLSSNSGALYHLVTTYSVMKSLSDVVLASPKSQIFKSQLAFRSKLLGFKSRCKAFAECTYISPRSNWYKKKYCQTKYDVNIIIILIFICHCRIHIIYNRKSIIPSIPTTHRA